jgi:hypothetical protein
MFFFHPKLKNRWSMTEDKIISFEEFRLKKQQSEMEDNPISKVLNQDLRDQKDLLDWYLFHRSFNKYKLFLHALFYNNHERLKGVNPNAGFIQVFDEADINSIVKATEDALVWLQRKYLIFDCKDKGIRDIGKSLPVNCNTLSDFMRSMQHYLLDTDHVLVFNGLSNSRINRNKADLTRSIIKINDDAHFKNISPRSDLVFIDQASFLEKKFKQLKIYIDILPSH